MESTERTHSNRLLIWIGVGLGVLVVVATAITLLRGPAVFEPGTPEAVVQEYIEAILDEDPEKAWTLLTPRLQRACEPDEMELRFQRARRGGIELIEATERGDSARVKLRFTAAYGNDPFDVYESSYRQDFRLRSVDGEWRIRDVPWPFDWCAR